MERKGPSFLHILITDYGTGAAALFIAMFWGLLAFDWFLGTGRTPQSFFYTVVAGTLICLFVIVWRIRLIGSVLEDGRELEGTITAANFFRDRGRITYIYSVNGERYQSSNMVARNARTKALQPGQTVMLMVDPDRPKAAFIRDLYL